MCHVTETRPSLRGSSRLRAALCSAWMLLALAAAAPVLAQERLTLCMEDADIWPWRTQDGKGLNFELISTAAAPLGVRLDYQPMPWKRCLAELKANRVDGAFAASFKPDRLEIGAFPGGTTPDANKRLYFDTFVLVRKKGAQVDWNGSEFKGLDGAIGAQLGYSVVDQLKAMQVKVDDGSASLNELLQKLAEGRIAMAAIGGSDGKRIQQSDGAVARQLEVLPTPLVEKPYFLMLSHALVAAKPELAQQLWNAIEATRQSKSYQRAEAAELKKSRP